MAKNEPLFVFGIQPKIIKKIYKTINRNIVYMHAVSNIHNRNIRIGDKVSECFVRFSDNTVSNRSWIGLGRWYRFFFFFCRTVVISPIARRLDGFFFALYLSLFHFSRVNNSGARFRYVYFRQVFAASTNTFRRYHSISWPDISKCKDKKVISAAFWGFRCVISVMLVSIRYKDYRPLFYCH